MKKLLPYISILILFSCNQYKEKNQKNIANNAFDNILNIQEKDFDYFDKKIIQRNDLRYLVENNKVSDSLKIFFRDSLTDEKIRQKKEKDFNSLKKEFIDNNIICKNIVFIDFTYKFDKEEFFDFTKGSLYFSYEKKVFMVDYMAFKIDDYYKLSEISNVRLKENESE